MDILTILNTLGQEIEAGRAVALATVVSITGSSPGKPGAKMLVWPDGRIAGTVGGGNLEATAIKDAVAVLAGGSQPVAGSRIVEYQMKTGSGTLGMWCDGGASILIEPFFPGHAVHIIGGGHIAEPLAEVLASCGFRITVADDRAELLTPGRFPRAETRVVKSYPDHFEGLELGNRDGVVIVTRGHSHDLECAERALRTGAGYIGMIGSRAKVAKVFSDLRSRGFKSDETGRIKAPIGLAIGAETPAEIAVAIAAQLIAWKKGFPFEKIRDIAALPDGR